MVAGRSDSTKSKMTSFKKMAGGPIECLENSLKTVVLRVQNLSRRQLAFAKSMVIFSEMMDGKLLRAESRGSPSAQVVFMENIDCDLKISISASDYKLAAPFMP
jgi:hypothetical protein